MAEAVFYVNGQFCSADEARVSILDRAFLMGDAIYDVARVQNGRIFASGRHYERMRRGLAELGIPMPFSAEDLDRVLIELAGRNRVSMGSVYVQVSRGATERTHLLPTNVTPTTVGFSSPADLPKWKPYADGVAAVTTLDNRWGRCDLKTTMLLPNSLAKQEAKDAGAFEAIFVAADGTVREGSSTSLFAVWDGEIHGHPLDEHILPGITRQIVTEIARAEGIPVIEETFDVGKLYAADEVLLTGTNSDVCPVVRIDGRPIKDGRIGPITDRLIALFAGVLEGETSR